MTRVCSLASLSCPRSFDSKFLLANLGTDKSCCPRDGKLRPAGLPWGRGSSGTEIALGCIMPLTHFFLVRLAQAATCRMRDPGTTVPSGVQEC